MNAEQQKGTSHHGDRGEGGTPTSSPGPQQTFAAWEQQRALTASLMEQVCDPKNLVRAYRRVRANKGKPGVDGMTVHALADWLRNNHVALTTSLLDGTYQPQPVRGSADSEAGWRTAPTGHSRGCGPLGSTGDLASAGAHSRPHLFSIQLRIPSWSKRSYGVRAGSAIRMPGGARDRRRFRSGKVL